MRRGTVQGFPKGPSERDDDLRFEFRATPGVYTLYVLHPDEDGVAVYHRQVRLVAGATEPLSMSLDPRQALHLAEPTNRN